MVISLSGLCVTKLIMYLDSMIPCPCCGGTPVLQVTQDLGSAWLSQATPVTLRALYLVHAPRTLDPLLLPVWFKGTDRKYD